MSIKEELKMYQPILDGMNKIPQNYRSANFINYLKELGGRVDKLKESLEYLEKHN